MGKDLSSKPLTASSVVGVNALCRSGVVLLSSHIEGYVENLGEVAIDRIGTRSLQKTQFGNQFRYHLSQDLIRNIFNSSRDPSIVEQNLLRLWERDSQIWDRSPNYAMPLPVDVFIGDFLNPNHSRIVKFFRRFGYDEFEHDMAARLKADYEICVNMINQVIDQRNKISHGDSNNIVGAPSDLEQMKTLVKRYCRETDIVAANWFRAQGCQIR
jgi:hypothetical protein